MQWRERFNKNMKRKLILLAAISTLMVGATAYGLSLDTSTTQDAALHAEISNDTAKAEKPQTRDEVKPDEAPVAPAVPVIDPNGCEAQGKWYRADNNECIDKPAPAPVAAAPSAPVAAAAPAPSAGSGDCSLVNNYPWPVATAHRVCMQESGGNPNNANWADDHTSWAGCMGSFGLMQINCSNGQLYDGASNMAVAFQMWSAAGGSFWKDWPNTCAKVGC